MNDKQVKLKRKSKTIWFNSVYFAIAAALLTVLNENAALLQEYMPGWGYLTLLMFNSAVNVWLRTKTTGPVEPLRKNND